MNKITINVLASMYVHMRMGLPVHNLKKIYLESSGVIPKEEKMSFGDMIINAKYYGSKVSDVINVAIEDNKDRFDILEPKHSRTFIAEINRIESGCFNVKFMVYKEILIKGFGSVMCCSWKNPASTDTELFMNFKMHGTEIMYIICTTDSEGNNQYHEYTEFSHFEKIIIDRIAEFVQENIKNINIFKAKQTVNNIISNKLNSRR